MKKLIKLTSVSIVLISAVACSSDETIKEEDNTKQEDTVEAVVEIDENINYTLPSPLQIANIFKNAGLSYIGDLTNPADNLSKYNERLSQKLNFGVYSADMAYCVLNNQTQESIYYIKTLKELSEKLWHMDVFNSISVLKRFEANVDNQDSLAYIIADLQMDLDEYLEENDMGSTSGIIFAGAWIESVYIGSNVLLNNDNEKLNSRLGEQAVILESLINTLKQAKEAELDDLIKDLEKLDSHFAPLRQEDTENYSLTKEQIEALAKDIKDLRTKIING